MSTSRVKIKIATVAVSAIFIFVGADAIVSTTINAQDIIGGSCEKVGEQKETCIGNTETAFYCSRPEGVARSCGYGYNAVSCSFPKNAVEDQCADQYINDGKICTDNGNSCAASCDDSSESCRKSCQCDPKLGVLYQCSTDYDIKFSSCLDSCGAKEAACRSTCSRDKSSCLRSAYDKYKQCDEARLIWKKVSATDCGAKNQVCIEKANASGTMNAYCISSSEQPQIPSQRIPTTPPVENTPDPSLYAACAIKCLDDVDTRYQCPLPSPSTDNSGISVIVLPDGSTRNFSPSDNKCVDDRGKTQNACLSQCPVTVGGEPIADPIGEGQKIKVAGVAFNDPLNEAAKYIDLLRRKPDLTRKEEDIKRILGDYEAGKPMSVWDVKGEPEMQVPGSDEWVTLKKGDAIPPGARIFTGMDDDLLVSLPGVYLVKVRSFTDITFNQTGIPKALLKGELINHLDLRTGDVEVHVERGTYQGTMQVRMPQAVAGVRGTHFWVSYDEAKRLGVVGVYEGEVAVDDLFRGTRTLLTSANDKTPRVIVILSTDSVSIQDQNIGAANSRSQAQERSNSNAWWLVVVIILVLGGEVLVLHKTGKLKPILQKVLALVRRNNSKPF